MKKKQKTPFIDKVFLWINFSLCLALLVSYLAPITDPNTMWIIAFFGLAYPFLLLANLILVVYWLFRKSKWALLSVITILIGFNVLFNNIGFSFDNAKIDPNKANLRVMTYNVHGFRKYKNYKEIITVRQPILDLIKQQHPDVIGIQEFDTQASGEEAMIDSLKKIMDSNQYYFEQFGGGEKVRTGMVIFSRWPIVAHGLIKLSDIHRSENQCLYIDVKKDNHLIRIYSLHLQSIRFEREDYKYLDTVSIGKTDLPSTKRVASKLKRAFVRRSEQVFKVKEHAGKCPYPYIISGDFNDTPSSFAVNQMAKGLKNTFREKGLGLGRTYNGEFPNFQIDYIMASPQFDVAGYNIIEKKLSDHYPVCADLVLKQ
jgi:endonuclease/exonuclease/phosphatase family metal-dependent hydrolase